MPTPEEILLGLEAIANDWLWLAVWWHLCFAVVVLALVFGVRPSRRTTGLLLTLPLLSVSLLAWLCANPFNGGIFAVAALALIVVSMRLPPEPVRLGPPWLAVRGGLMAGFGWVYPHFLTDAQPWLYLFAAPTGLLPCPTISVVLGLSLVLGGLGSRLWCLILAFVGLFYGAFGAAGLGISIDWTLFAGALLILYVGLSQQPARNRANEAGK